MSTETTTPNATTTYVVHLRPQVNPSDPQGIRRMRSGLKCLLRRFGLRCIAVVPSLKWDRYRTHVLG